MKKAVSILLVAVMCCSLIFSMTSCGADQSGEWGAYYQAFRAFSKSIPSEVDCICLGYDGIEEENQKKLYDLFFEYCDDRNMRIYTGEIMTMLEIGRLDMNSDLFKNACYVSFCDAVWNEDRTEVSMAVSIRYGLFADAENSGGIATVSKTKKSWKAVSLVNEKDIMNTQVGAYAEILKYYMRPEIQIDPINKRYISLDPEDISEELLPDVRNYVRMLFGKQGMSYLEYTWQELSDNGYLSGSTFTDGYHFSFSEATWSEDGKQVKIDSWMKEADLKALGGIFTLTLTEDGWQITNVEEMVS